MTDTLTQLRICVEKPLSGEEHVMKAISDKSNSPIHFQKLSAAFFSKKLWPKNSTIKISFVASSNDVTNVDWTPLAVLKTMKNQDGTPIKLDPLEEELRKLPPVEAIKKVVRERIQPIVGLKFVFVARGGNVRISFNPHGGCWSLVGTDCLKHEEEATMNFGWLDCGTIMHEFGHVLGLVHEHQNPNGIDISWDDSKVYAWAKQTQNWDQTMAYHNIIERYKIDQLNASKFDPKSIMLYFFPASLTTDNKGTNGNHTLSNVDIEYISKVYPGGHMTPLAFSTFAYGKLASSNGKKININWYLILYISLALIAAFILIIFIVYIYKRIKSKPKFPELLKQQRAYNSPIDVNNLTSIRSYNPPTRF